jgi:act minimal PKS acyl carrier protein
MREFTLADLTRIMRASVGVDDSVDLDGEILDTLFTDLGYDSLAKLEIASKVDLEVGTTTPDDAVTDLETPRQFVAYVNERLAERSEAAA